MQIRLASSQTTSVNQSPLEQNFGFSCTGCFIQQTRPEMPWARQRPPTLTHSIQQIFTTMLITTMLNNEPVHSSREFASDVA